MAEADLKPGEPISMEIIRVFVSSTFRDMQAERDQLVRKVFPRLRSECLRRGGDFVAIDLRWGITQEETDTGFSLSICLKEIDRCRPFFISLLGDRYGWVPTPEEVPPAIFEQVSKPENSALLDEWYELDETTAAPLYRLRKGKQPPENVRNKLLALWEGARLEGAGDSVTAWEIHHAAFHKEHSKTNALFYIRDSALLDDPGLTDPFKKDFFETDEDRRARLDRLKAEILQAPLSE